MVGPLPHLSPTCAPPAPQFSAMDEAGKRAARQRFQRAMATFSGVVVLAWPRLGAREGERPTIVSFEEGAEAAMVEALSAGAFQT